MIAPLNRRNFLKWGGACLGLNMTAHVSSGQTELKEASAPPSLRLYTWTEYFKPQLVKMFENDHGCRVELSTFASNEELLINLEAEKGRYDLITPSAYMIGMLRRNNLVRPLETPLLSNRTFIEPVHLNATEDPSMEWSLPFAVSVSGIGYNVHRHKPHLPSWQAFDEPAVIQGFSLLDDMREVLGAALRTIGKSVNSTVPADIEAAKELASRWIRNARKLQSEGYRANLTSGEDKLSHGYGGDFLHEPENAGGIQFFIPEEGAPTTNDHFCIPVNSQSAKLAHEFINFFSLPHIAAQNMEWSGFRSTIGEARNLLPASLSENPILYPPIEVRSRCEPLADLGNALPAYETAWSALMNG
jgi:spermidine/putrescine transport system substrate-binding protein